MHGVDFDDAADGTASGVAIERLGVGRFHWLAVLILGLANASDAVEVLCIGFVLPVLPEEWGVTGPQKGGLSAAVFAGMLVGGLVGGALSDAIGRRRTLAVALLLNVVAGVAAAGAPGWQLLVAARVLAGAGVGASVPPVFSLTAELLPRGGRGFWLSLIAWAWTLGTVLTAGLAWATLGSGASWRLFVALAASPAAVALALLLAFVPESPRWLELSGDVASARASLRYIARVNGASAEAADETVTLAASALSPVSGAKAAPNGSLASSIAGGGRSSSAASSCAAVCARIAALFAPSLLCVTCCMLLAWFILSLAWYGLGVWLPSLYDRQGVSLSIYADAFISAASSVPGNAAASFLLDRAPRKWLLFASLVGGAGCLLALALVQGEAALIAASSLNNAITALAWNAVNVLSTEAFPTAARSTAMGVLSATGRLGSIAGQLLFGFLLETSQVALLTTIATLVAVAAISAALLPASAAPLIAGSLRGGGASAYAPLDKSAAAAATCYDDEPHVVGAFTAADKSSVSGAAGGSQSAAAVGPIAREGSPLLSIGHTLPTR